MKRLLKIVPIVHTQIETRIPYTPRMEMAIRKAWEIIEPAVRNCYSDWKGIQIYVDGFAIPKAFRDPEMTPEKYKLIWMEELKEIPLGKLVKELVSQGAILESTEIRDKNFWIEYKETLTKAIANPVLYVRKLDKLDEEREKYISEQLSKTLRKKGVLLIGRKHIGKFKFAEDIEVIYI